MFKVEYVGKCRVCAGSIAKRVRRLFDASSGPLIIGPGSRRQFYEDVSYDCVSCGLVYARPPATSGEAEPFNPAEEAAAVRGALQVVLRRLEAESDDATAALLQQHIKRWLDRHKEDA